MSSWNHIVLEGHCMYEDEEFKDVPCCDIKSGFASVVCLSDCNGKRCPYFGYTEARSCIVLTDAKGLDTACDTFFADESDNAEYIRKENEWIKGWKKRIEKNRE